MKNTSFMLRKQEEKADSIMRMLQHRTNNALDNEQLRKLILTLRNDRQYEVSIFTDPNAFCEATVLVTTSERSDRCTVVFGKALPGRATDESYSPTQMFDDNQPAAFVISKRTGNDASARYYNALLMYIPERQFRKGASTYAKQTAQHRL